MARHSNAVWFLEPVGDNSHLRLGGHDHYPFRVSTMTTGILPVVAIDRSSPKPLHRQLYEGYRKAIVERRLRARQRLPSTRGLAAELEISRIPILNAFEQLRAEGYLEGRIGSGTYVASTLPDELLTPAHRISARKPLDRVSRRPIARRVEGLLPEKAAPWLRTPGSFHIGEPPLDRFPVEAWSRLVARHARNAGVNQLHYGEAMGLLSLREAVAEYLRTARAVSCEAEQIMIVNGSQQALEIASHVLLDPGSPVWFEEPGYFGARRALGLAGARLVPVPVDDEGLDVSTGIGRCPRPRAVFVTPSHQFPLGTTMSATRRLQLLDWARRCEAWVLEDDYDSEYRFGNLPIASLQGLDRDLRVIYVGTFSKILFPSLRLAYVVIPPDLVEAFIEARGAMDLSSPTFHQLVLADFIREGHFGRHIRKMRLLCRERRRVLVDALRRNLPGLTILGDRAGMYLSVSLPDGLGDREICEKAFQKGLRAAPLSDCYLETPRQGLLLGYGGTAAEEIEDGVRQLREVIDSLAAAGSTSGPRQRTPAGQISGGTKKTAARARAHASDGRFLDRRESRRRAPRH
jgi:GntR family transcriptional regulator/MocR family aminotransferase